MTAFDDLLKGIYSATVTDVSVLVREVHVRIGVLVKPVVVRIYYDGRAGEPYRFVLSARMKPAADREPGIYPRNAPSEEEALRRAVRLLTQDYEEAVRRGLMPDDRWLVAADE